MTAFIDTSVLIRHLTGDPPEMARSATSNLADATEILLTDLVVAETVSIVRIEPSAT